MADNRWRMSPAGFPEYDFEPTEQPRGLVPMGQVMDGDIDPFLQPEPVPTVAPQQQYGQGQPTGKKILGMPKDQFIALMGTIAHAMAPRTASGRLGAGMVNMADMMRTERIEQGKIRAAKAKEREVAAKERKRLAEKKEKVPSAWEATYKEMEGKINPETKLPYTAAEKVAAYKKIGEKEEKIVRDKGFKQIEGIWYTGTWGKEDQFTPRRPAAEAEIAKLTKVAPVTGEKIMTSDKAREKLFAIAKFKSSLSKTGGWNETVFELMAQKDPEFAKRALSINSSKAEVNTTIKELEGYYKGIISGKPTAKKEETFDIEEQNARDAINQGIPADRVREMYKRRTGKELGL